MKKETIYSLSSEQNISFYEIKADFQPIIWFKPINILSCTSFIPFPILKPIEYINFELT